MITGCEKRVIVVKDTGSDIFDEAYFIVSKNIANTERNDFLLEANRIISSRTVERHKRRGRIKKLLWLGIGFFAGASLAASTVCFIM